MRGNHHREASETWKENVDADADDQPATRDRNSDCDREKENSVRERKKVYRVSGERKRERETGDLSLVILLSSFPRLPWFPQVMQAALYLSRSQVTPGHLGSRGESNISVNPFWFPRASSSPLLQQRKLRGKGKGMKLTTRISFNISDHASPVFPYHTHTPHTFLSLSFPFLPENSPLK